jgi:hypothetical protein
MIEVQRAAAVENVATSPAGTPSNAYVMSKSRVGSDLWLGRKLGLLLGVRLGRELGLRLGRELGLRLGRELGLRLGRELGLRLGCELGAGIGGGGTGGGGGGLGGHFPHVYPPLFINVQGVVVQISLYWAVSHMIQAAYFPTLQGNVLHSLSLDVYTFLVGAGAAFKVENMQQTPRIVRSAVEKFEM